MQNILLVEDQLDFQLTVKALLEQRYRLHLAPTAADALVIAGRAEIDLVLLDVTLPDDNGFNLITRLKALPGMADVPVLFLTGHGEVTDRVTGFALGAEDYIVKPFEPLEFRARIDARLHARLSRKQATAVVTRGRLQLDRSMFKAFIVDPAIASGKPVDLQLTPHEFRLLVHFVAHVDQVLTRDQIMSAVWGGDIHVLERTIDRHVSALRKKLGNDHERIEPVHGVGYRFTVLSGSEKIRA